MKRPSGKFNIKYAIGEVLLIFIGISLAIAFNNWNESRRIAKMESATLVELRNGIQTDITDMESSLRGHQNRVDVYKKLIDALESNKPLNDSINQYIGYLYGKTSLIANRAPFETLKARGVDLISNDSLRQDILTYYEIKQDWLILNENDHIENHREYIEPLIIDYFRFKPLNPKVFKALKEDQKVLPSLKIVLLNDTYVVELYQDLHVFALDLTDDINTELDVR